MEPIDILNQPTHKEVRRLSYFFEGGIAQDFTLEPEDQIEILADAHIIVRGSRDMRETIFLHKVTFMRDQRLIVKIRPKHTLPTPSGGGDG